MGFFLRHGMASCISQPHVEGCECIFAQALPGGDTAAGAERASVLVSLVSLLQRLEVCNGITVTSLQVQIVLIQATPFWAVNARFSNYGPLMVSTGTGRIP